MNDPDPDLAQLARIADTLERLAPPPPPPVDPARGAAFRWDGARLASVERPAAMPLQRFAGIDGQRAALSANLAALARGGPAHDMLLWGARGMGKSALVRAVATARQVALVEAGSDELPTLPSLFATLSGAARPFLIFIDDLAFAESGAEARQLRSLLDGGIAERPPHVRLAVTSNHRHLIARPADEGRHARDSADDSLALVDRFGLVLGFHAPDQDIYLDMVRRHLAAVGIDAFDPADALAFALARGGRSGRTAWHYRTELLVRRSTGL